MTTKITAAKAAEELGVTAATIKEWAQRLGLDCRSDEGTWLFDEEQMHLLRVIRKLREEGSGMDTIARRLQPQAPEAPEPGPAPVLGGDTPPRAELQVGQVEEPGAARPEGSGELHPLVAQVIDAIKQQTLLVDKFAWATHRIGRLEVENENLRAQLADTRAQLDETRQRLAEEIREREALRARVDRLAAQHEEQRQETGNLFRKLERAQEQIARLKTEISDLTQELADAQAPAEQAPAEPPAPPPAPPWWRRWLAIRRPPETADG